MHKTYRLGGELHPPDVERRTRKRAARLHNPTPNHDMEQQCLPLSVPVAGTFLHVRCTYGCRASRVCHSMRRRAGASVSDCCAVVSRDVGAVDGGEMSCDDESPSKRVQSAGTVQWGEKTGGRGGFETRIGRVLGQPHGCTGNVSLGWERRENADAAVDAGGRGVCAGWPVWGRQR
jgi:hypothetical protein